MGRPGGKSADWWIGGSVDRWIGGSVDRPGARFATDARCARAGVADRRGRRARRLDGCRAPLPPIRWLRCRLAGLRCLVSLRVASNRPCLSAPRSGVRMGCKLACESVCESVCEAVCEAACTLICEARRQRAVAPRDARRVVCIRGSRLVACGSWLVAYGVRRMACGVRLAACGSRSWPGVRKSGMRIASLGWRPAGNATAAAARVSSPVSTAAPRRR